MSKEQRNMRESKNNAVKTMKEQRADKKGKRQDRSHVEQLERAPMYGMAWQG
ncbi:MAG: hypothetical protein O2868_00735 [Proteobacteria bacterium]|jgi:hypothetical protein|nr:hypothetical protein [Pseudomonadota bacterium]